MEEQKMQTSDSKKKKVAGKMTFNFTQQEAFDVGDVIGHTISLRKAAGVNKSTGSHDFMDGAQSSNLSFDDLVNGSGPHQGYSTLEKNGDVIISKWEGQIVTLLSSEGHPIPGFGGTLHWIKATGHFANMVGNGTYKGHFTSETSYDVEWEGEYWIEK
jgi:hypothetical protein